MTIAHVINPVNVKPTSDLFIAQPVTFASMRRAKEEAKTEVTQYYTCYDEDLPVAPEDFTPLPLLERAVTDVGTFQKPRKLPILGDILDRLAAASDAEYLIYTNVDIALQPHFYDAVAQIIDQGYDGFVINRRTISDRYRSVDELEKMYADRGEKHPGYDCFVFRRDACAHYDLGDACIGANWIGRVLLSNVIAYAERFKIFEEEHLTFHIGDDRSWKIADYNDYDRHNEAVVVRLLQKFEHLFDRKPMLRQFHDDHAKWIAERRRFEHIAYHTTTLELPAPASTLYGDAYRPSSAWETPLLLRQDPIFVVGYPRSGTTLLQSLLATQADLFSLPEVHFFYIVRQKLVVKDDRIQPECLEATIETIRERVRLSTNLETHLRQQAEAQALSPKMLYEAIIVDNVLDTADQDDCQGVGDRARNGNELLPNIDPTIKDSCHGRQRKSVCCLGSKRSSLFMVFANNDVDPVFLLQLFQQRGMARRCHQRCFQFPLFDDQNGIPPLPFKE